MGKIAKIEQGKNSSDAFGGCAPIEWLNEVASDFAKWALKGVFDVGKQLKNNVTQFFSGGLEWLSGAGNKLVDLIPGSRQVQKTLGVMVNVGKSVAQSAGGCIKAALVGLGIAGAVAGGAAVISGLGGLGAVLGGLAVIGFIGMAARWLIRGVQKAYTFNWNISDKQIQERYKNNIRNISGRLGGVVGTGLATLLCGVAPGAAITVINPLALALVKEVYEDGWAEIKGNLNALIQTTGAAVQEWIVLESFKNVRSAIKKSAARGVLGSILPEKLKRKIEGWGAEGAKPWTFAEKVEEKIESIKNPNLRAFTEEAVEEFMDVCSEQTYALTYAF